MGLKLLFVQLYNCIIGWFHPKSRIRITVDDVLGREVLLDLVAAKERWTPESVEEVLSQSLEEAVADRRTRGITHYENHPNAIQRPRLTSRASLSTCRWEW